MRRSICYTEPKVATAGERSTWQFIYTTAVALPKGTRLKFDMTSKGRDIDWELPNTNLKDGTNVIFLHLEGKKPLAAKEVIPADGVMPQYEFVLPCDVPSGDSLTIAIGDMVQGKKAVGNAAQSTAQRRRPFLLYVDTSGKGRYDEPEVFSLDVRGGPLHNIRILTPSFVGRNKRFDIIVRFEDEFGNLTSNSEPESLIELTHEHLRENLSWRLFIPETGFLTLPNLYFNEPGVYSISLKNLKTNEAYRSAPIKCFPENDISLYWGLLHGESDRYDSTESIESCLRHFRDDRALNFAGSSPFESAEETPNDVWRLVSQNINDFNEDDRFTTFLGFQWIGEPKQEGLRLIIFNKDSKPVLRKKDTKYSSLKKIYKAFAPKEILSIPSFTMGKGFDFDFKDFDPNFERVVEIYNAWGSSETTAKEGNPLPVAMEGKSKGGASEVAEGAIQKALARNLRFGFVAGGLDDRGAYSTFFESNQVQYAPGLTAIIAKEHTRATLLEALFQRSCYATTGARIIITLNIAGIPMGGESTTADKPGFAVNRHITSTVAGTTSLAKVELIRNGQSIHTITPKNEYTVTIEYDDLTPLNKATINAKDGKPPFVYYYIRVTQEDGHMAWSSPIWIDDAPSPGGRKRLPPKPQKKSAAVAEVLLEDFDDEEEDLDDETIV